MRANDIGFNLHTELEKPVMHLLKEGKIVRESTKPITEKALDITLAVEFMMPTAITVR